MSTEPIQLQYSVNMPAEEALDTAEEEIRDLHGRVFLSNNLEITLKRAEALSKNINEAQSLGDYVEVKYLNQELERLSGSIKKAKDIRNRVQETPFIKEQGLSLDWIPFKGFGDLVLLYSGINPNQNPPRAFWKPCQDNQFRLLANISHHSGKAFVVSTWTFSPNGSNSKLQIDALMPEDHSEISDLPLQNAEIIFEDNATDVLHFLVDFAYNRTSNETAVELLPGVE